MDPQTVAERLEQVQLVDVRYDKEWEAGHIEGAVHIPEDDLEDRLDELDRNRPVITVCRAGTRSDDAAEWLRGQGFDAHSVDGGMLAWKWAGLPISGRIVEPDPKPELDSDEMQYIHHQFIEIALAVQERFGVGVQPSEEEILGFLRERLITEGRTPEEADAFLAEMGEGLPDGDR
jgi:rhodanese-related sulfurtransferase